MTYQSGLAEALTPAGAKFSTRSHAYSPEEVEEIRLAVDPYFQKLADCQTAEEIRKFLADEEVKAIPGISSDCAVAAYLTAGSGHQMWVGRTHTWITNGYSEGDLRIVNTPAMEEFTREFDKLSYPELVDQPRWNAVKKARSEATERFKHISTNVVSALGDVTVNVTVTTDSPW